MREGERKRASERERERHKIGEEKDVWEASRFHLASFFSPEDISGVAV